MSCGPVHEERGGREMVVNSEPGWGKNRGSQRLLTGGRDGAVGADKWSHGLPYVGAHPWDKAGGQNRAVAHWRPGSTTAGANGGCT
jgi:hypothetical protein